MADMRYLKWSLTKEKQIQLLHRKKYRKQDGLFLLEGFRAVEQAVHNAKLHIESLLITEVFKESVAYWAFINQSTPSIYLLSAKEMKAITTTEQAPGCMAVCKIPKAVELQEIAKNSKRLIALDRIQDPGNLGTIIRTALWFGWDGLLLGDGTVDPFNPKVVRSTVGATAGLPYCSVKLGPALDQLEENGWQVHLLDVDEQSQDLASAKLGAGQHVLVLGNEANGIQDKLKRDNRLRFHITGSSQQLIESLNAAVALGIGLYHFGQSEE